MYSINTQTTHKSTHNCSQCNSPLVLISKKTEKIEGVKFPQTMTIYRCSNKVCQDQKDREYEKRIKQMEDKVSSDKIRAQLKLRRKKPLKKDLIKEAA